MKSILSDVHYQVDQNLSQDQGTNLRALVVKRSELHTYYKEQEMKKRFSTVLADHTGAIKMDVLNNNSYQKFEPGSKVIILNALKKMSLIHYLQHARRP